MTPDKKNGEQNEQMLLTMQGLPDDDGDVPADLFILAFSALRGLMGKIAEQRMKRMGKQKIKVRFFIAELSHSSPVCGGIGAVSTDNNVLAGDVMAKAEGFFLSVQNGKGDDIPAAILSSMEKIVKGYKNKRLSTIKIQRLNGRADPHPSVEVNARFIRYLDDTRKMEIREIQGGTTIAGEVRLFDLHEHSGVTLRIHPEIGQPVECHLPPEAKDKALEAIGKRAAITGVARYRPDPADPFIQHPYRIDAQSDGIEIFHIGPNSPKLSDFRGAFPNLTGGKDTLEYLRELRGED